MSAYDASSSTFAPAAQSGWRDPGVDIKALAQDTMQRRQQAADRAHEARPVKAYDQAASAVRQHFAPK